MPSPTEISILAPAKVNLFLHVGAKRKDGFSDLESLVVFSDIGDVLTLKPADALSLTVAGPFASQLKNQSDNLVLRATQAFASQTRTTANFAITLRKNLPVASGIGGGSADAAAMLRGLAQLAAIGHDAVFEIAARLGSDVPACLLSRPLMMRGRGERLEPLAGAPVLHAVLINPMIEVATAKVFAGLQQRSELGLTPSASELSSAETLISFLRKARNDLEMPAHAIAPQVGEVLGALAQMPGNSLARMSGSGATCFGLFAGAKSARDAADAIARAHLGWWVKAARLEGVTPA